MLFDKRFRPLLSGIAAGVVLLAGLVVWVGPNSAGAVQARVQSAADAALSTGGHAGISARAEGQTIVLTGISPSREAADDAVASVKASRGSQASLAGAVERVDQRLLDVAPKMSPYRFRVEHVADRVAVTGFSPSRSDLADVRKAATALFGQQGDVEVDLAIGAPEGVNWALASIEALEAVSRLESGYAELSDRRLIVTGVAADQTAASELSARLARFSGALERDIDIVGPADWSATYEGGRLRIVGRVASVAAKRSFMAAANLPFGAVTDESVVFQDQPVGWHTLVARAMPHLVRFQSGRVAVHGSIVRVTGQAPGSVLGYLRADLGEGGGGYTVDIAARESAVQLDGIVTQDLTSESGVSRSACEDAFAAVMARSKVLFASETARITRESGVALDRIVEVARRCAAFSITVEGHTDNTGRREGNLVLSRNRAQAVVDYMVERGIDAGRLTASGVGPDRPAASNRSGTGRATNRRIEFKVSDRDVR